MSSQKTHFHIQQSKIGLSTERAWELLTDIHLLARLAPPWLSIEQVSGARSINEDSGFELKIRKGILKGGWKLRVTTLRKGFLIGFEILSPRKRVWVIWTKLLPGENANSCILEDRVEYQTSVLLGKTSARIERTIKEIIYYRHHTLKCDLSVLGLADRSKAQEILIAGGSGLVGSHFSKLAKSRGHQVRLLSTRKSAATLHWDPERGMIDPDALEGYDTVLNFAGFPIACRWTAKNRQRILDSRIKSSHLLVKTIKRLSNPPKNYIQASATGYYGYNNQLNVNETTEVGEGFLADVCKKWEAESLALADSPTVSKTVRLGVVLSPEGGALAKMLPAFQLGIAGKLGNGKQFFPWISIDDLSRALVYLVENPGITGTYNLCSPQSTHNSDFTQALASVLSRPAVFPVPAFLMRFLFGNMAREALLGGVDARPEALENLGFQFAGSDLEESLKLLLGKS